MPRFDGGTYNHELDGPRLTSEMERVRDVVQAGGWWYLRDIAAITGYPEGSISARLRDFRKPKFGQHIMNCVRVKAGLWKYQVIFNNGEVASHSREEKTMTTSSAILKHPLWELSRGCDACELRQKCRGAVPSEGDIRAKLLLVGEAPGCFPAGTPVSVPEGVKYIEDIVVGDEVFDQEGGVQRVLRTYKRTSPEDLVEVSLRGGHKIRCTPEHPILVIRTVDCDYGGLNHIRVKCMPCKEKKCPLLHHDTYMPRWVAAADLEPHDYVLTPKRPLEAKTSDYTPYFSGHQRIDVNPYFRVRAGDHKPYSGKEFRHLRRNGLPIRKSTAFLFGWYMAEGHSNINGGVVNLSCGVDDRKWFEFLKQASAHNLKRVPAIYEYQGTGTVRLAIHSRIWARMFLDLFGSGARNKRIPPVIFQGQQYIAESFVHSWYLGDGSHKQGRVDGIYTASDTGKDHLTELLIRMGIVPTVAYSPPKMSTSGIKGNGGWTITYRPAKALPTQRVFGFDQVRNSVEWKNYHAVQVNSVNLIPGTEGADVYNIETEDNTYCVPFVVHNSNEDVKARPFIGAAGQELENYLWSILGMRRRDVFLSNTVLCRPSGSDVKKDWAPNKDNIEICTRLWLEPTLELVKPKIVASLGAVATRYFFPGEKITMDAVNGIPRMVTRKWGSFIVVPVYHPAAGLHESKTMNAIQFGFRMVRDALDGVWVEVVDEYPEPEYEVN